jgi:N-acetylglucosaminyldiphosphoundecaprenol N-acetyl-beta-D-mannosaminyltransferase
MYKIFGVDTEPMSIDELNSIIGKMMSGVLSKRIIASLNLHSVYLSHKDKKIKSFFDISYKRADGMPIILWGKLLGFPFSRNQRVTWVDWMDPFMNYVQKNKWKIFYLGSKPEIANSAIVKLRKKFPDIEIVYHDGYFNVSKEHPENKQVLADITKEKPDILLVGMGMPRQEHWIYDNYSNINVKVIITCGAAMEYVAGYVTLPPRWMGRLCLEWLYRLSENPLRFFTRYLIEPWFIIPWAIRDLLDIYVVKKNKNPNNIKQI